MDTTTLEHWITYGQSNSLPAHLLLGGRITSAPAAPGRAFMFAGGIAPNFNVSHRWGDRSYQARNTPLEMLSKITDLDLDFDKMEAIEQGFAATFHRLERGRRTLHSLHGVAGSGIIDLGWGTAPFLNILTAVREGMKRAAELGMKYRVAGIIFVHGEANAYQNSYYTLARLLFSDLREEIASMTGQRRPIEIYHSQMANWAFSPDRGGRAVGPLIQLKLHRGGYARLAFPSYWLRHPGSNLHLDGYGKRLLGEKFAQFATTPRKEPLYPTAIRAYRNIVYISFKGRVGRLRWNIFDKDENPNGVSDPGHKGFEAFDPGGAYIVSVGLSSFRRRVKIVLSGIPSPGYEIAYAYTGRSGAEAGPLYGPRGCLSDSDPFEPSEEIVHYRRHVLWQYPDQARASLCNWCVVFRDRGGFVGRAEWLLLKSIGLIRRIARAVAARIRR